MNVLGKEKPSPTRLSLLALLFGNGSHGSVRQCTGSHFGGVLVISLHPDIAEGF